MSQNYGSAFDPLAELDTAIALHQAGRLDEAAAIYRRILDAQPAHSEVLYLLGRVDFDQGRIAEAEARMYRAIELDGAQARYHQELGQALGRLGRVAEGVESFQAAIRLKPDYATAHFNLAGAYYTLEKLDETEAALREAIRWRPDFAMAHQNLAALLRRQDRRNDALACLHEVVRLQRDNWQAWSDLAEIYRLDGDLAQVADAYREVLRLRPRDASAHYQLGIALFQQGRLSEALAAYRASLEIEPANLETLVNIGAVHMELHDLAAAEAAYRQATAVKPDSHQAHANLGTALKLQGATTEAIEAYRAAIQFGPSEHQHHSCLLYALNFTGDFTPEEIFAEHARWGAQHADPLTPARTSGASQRDPNRRLRVGYVSTHFFHQAVNSFFEPILKAHDHEALEVFCYSNLHPSRHDDVTVRLQGCADHWRQINHLTDEQAAQLVRQDEIDILVDLVGHIPAARLLVFARKAAPIQVTYLGYQNTTGMQAMDYRLTDSWSDPPGMTDRFYTEQLVRLEPAFFCYQPSEFAPVVESLPLDANGFVTFGSFNDCGKITPAVLSAWARIMGRVPNSRLVVVSRQTEALQARIVRALAQEHVGPERLAFHDRMGIEAFLRLVGQVDIALDPFPFNGHTTTCDTLWMGVPVVCQLGDSYASRFGSSAHHVLGLEELIAHSTEEYIDLAVRLAADRARLEQYRRTLREQFAASPLVDATGFTRHLEAAYRQMWQTWLASN